MTSVACVALWVGFVLEESSFTSVHETVFATLVAYVLFLMGYMLIGFHTPWVHEAEVSNTLLRFMKMFSRF